MAYDTMPLVSINEKQQFLKEAADARITLFFEHDLYTECCQLEYQDGSIAVARVFKLSELF